MDTGNTNSLSAALKKEINQYFSIDCANLSDKDIAIKLFVRSMHIQKQINWVTRLQDRLIPVVTFVERYFTIPFISKHRHTWVGNRSRQLRLLIKKFESEVSISELLRTS